MAPRIHRTAALAWRAIILMALSASSTAVEGQSLWQWAKGDDNGTNEFVRDIAVDTVNNFVYVVGAYDNAGILLGLGASGLDGFLTKSDLNGNIQWTQRIGTSGTDAAMGVAVGTNGDIYVTGFYSASAFLTFPAVVPATTSGGTDMFLACFTPTGATSWVRTGGGAANDQGIAVAVNSSGVFVQGLHQGLASFSGSASNPVLNSGTHSQAMLLKYSMGGVLQWQMNGGCGSNGNMDVNPERIACDVNGVYVTGTFETNQMSWYPSTSATAQTITATGTNQNIYIYSVNNAGVSNWAQCISNPGDAAVNGNAIAVSCRGVYIAGSTHNNSTFPGSVTVNVVGAPHDHLYVAALNCTTGTTQWVRTATGPEEHQNTAYDLSIQKNQNILVCGQFEESITFKDTTLATTGGGGYKLDAFLARYTPSGQMDWAIMSDGSDDNVPMAVAPDNNDGIYSGGAFQVEMTFPPYSLSGNGNSNYYWAKFTDSPLNYWPANPTNWRAPTAMCANAAPLDLNTTLPPMTQGSVDAIAVSSGVVNPNNILGAPNSNAVAFTTHGWSLTADLTDTITAGNTYVIRWSKMTAAAGTAALVLEASKDGVTWTAVPGAPQITRTTALYVNSLVQANVDTRYIRITKNNAASPVSFRVDAIKFYSGSITDGTWSGPGVSGSTFNPTGLSGPVAITYSSGNAPCPYSTSKTITIDVPASPGAMTVAPATLQCPGSNSCTAVLSGHTGTINHWESSTNNFTTYTTIANTSATQSFSNLGVSTTYRARLNGGACGNIYSANETVNIGDVTPPAITCPASISVNVTPGTCGAIVNYVPPVGTDNCLGASTIEIDGLASGMTFPVGVKNMIFQVADATGLTASCSFSVTVIDNIAPQISCPVNISVNADAGSCGAVVNYVEPIGTDNCAGSTTTRTAGLASGSTFPIGVNTVTYQVTDPAGLTASCSFTITVADTIAPQITCPADRFRNADDYPICTRSATWANPVVTDNCGSVILAQLTSFTNGQQFPIDTTIISYRATDAAGNFSTCSFRVIVRDVNAPHVICPLYDYYPIYLDATCNLAFPDLRDTVTVRDCSPTTNAMDPPAGTIFTRDTTFFMTMDIDDDRGNHVDNDHWIHIVDNTPPLFSPVADQVLAMDGNGGIAVPDLVPFYLSATDCTGPIVSSQSIAPGTLVSTTSLIVVSVQDAVGNTSIDSVLIIPFDNLPPTLVCPANISAIAPPGTCGASVSFIATATDNSGTAPTITYSHVPGSSFPIGSTTVTVNATDGINAAPSCQFIITVTPTVVDVAYPVTSVCASSGAVLPSVISPAGGVFSDASQTGTINAITGQFYPSAADPGSHTISYAFAGACASQDLFTIAVVAPPDAGSNGSFIVCPSGPVVDLFAQLGGTPQAGGSWALGGIAHSGMYDPAIDASGIFTYTVLGSAPCGPATSTIVMAESNAIVYFADQDGDSFGDPANSVLGCVAPGGYVTNNVDGCPLDANKVAPGQCGCGITDTDTDSDGIANCNDGCPNDPNKVAPGICGCGTDDLDTDGDLTADCNDGCPTDPNKVVPGVCGCNNPETICLDCTGVPFGTAFLDNCGTCVGGTTGNTACTADCAGVFGGTAFLDNCGTCVGGTTGNVACTADCAGVLGGTAFLDNCGTCVGGTTGNTACTADCAGVFGGTAFLDNCGTCVGGTTGNTACTADCAGVFGGTAFLDNCGTCVGGTTGNVACTADCAGVLGGTAFLDNCGTCVGGTTGNTACTADCAGVFGGTAFLDNCGTCVGGTTGNTACTADCAGVLGGTAFLDNCGTCVGGTTGNTACTADCAGVFGGTAFLDNCGTCVGGTTGNTACTADCAGVLGGTAFLDNCGTCVGGTTGNTACTADCAGVFGGTAFLDNCGTCVGGTTGNTACTADCAGVFGGTAFLDNCGTCVGGTTGNTACTADCAGVFGGTAFLDNCGTCVGGTTGNTACTADCAGVFGGTAFLDNCGTCVGGTTGNTACTADCAGVFGGTAFLDNCGTCVGGTTGNTACTADCAGVLGGTAFLDNCGTCVGGTTGNVACTADCAGVWGGTQLPGTPCDDSDPSTIDDTWSSNCQCIGTSLACFADAGLDQSICGTSTTMQATLNGLSSWSGPSNIIFNDPWGPTTSIGTTIFGSFDLVWTVNTGSCLATDTVVVTFIEPANGNFSYSQNSYCVNDVAVLPIAINNTGTYSAYPASGLALNTSTGLLTPTASIPGTYTITHTISGPCPANATRTISITGMPNANWNAPAAMCSTSEPLFLPDIVTGTDGGTWSGTGVDGSYFNPPSQGGAFEVAYAVWSGSCHAQVTHTLIVTPSPETHAGPTATVCGNMVQLQAQASSGTGMWSLPMDITALGDLSDPNLEVHSSTFGRYDLYWTVTYGPCVVTDTVSIYFLNPDLGLTVDAGPDQDLDVVSSTTFQGSASAGAITNWWLLSGDGNILDPSDTTSLVEALGLGDNYFVLTVSLGQCASVSDTVLIRVDDLFIPEGFSPNGDGVNDRWEITGMAAFPGSKVQVFNRWGQLVYESNDYENEWDGRAIYGRDLPDATYFYVLNLTGDRAYNGHVILKR